MDAERFDALTRDVAAATSRRAFLRGLVGGLLALLGGRSATATSCQGLGAACSSAKTCCSGACCDGRCCLNPSMVLPTAPSVPVAPPLQCLPAGADCRCALPCCNGCCNGQCCSIDGETHLWKSVPLHGRAPGEPCLCDADCWFDACCDGQCCWPTPAIDPPVQPPPVIEPR